MFQFWQFHNVLACAVVYLYCLILQQEIFTSDMNSYEVEFWKSFSFAKVKGDHKVLIFGSKSSWLGTHGKDNSNKKVKSILIIHVCNKFDMWFWWFLWVDGGIFDNINSECSWEWFIVLFCSGIFGICVWWEETFIDAIIFCSKWFVWWSTIICWQRLAKIRKNGIPPFLNLKKDF